MTRRTFLTLGLVIGATFALGAKGHTRSAFSRGFGRGYA